MKIPAWLFISFWAVISITFLHLGFHALDKTELSNSVYPVVMFLFKHFLALSSCFSSSYALKFRARSNREVRSNFLLFVYVFFAFISPRTIEGTLIWHVLKAVFAWLLYFLFKLKIFLGMIFHYPAFAIGHTFRLLWRIKPIIGVVLVVLLLNYIPPSSILAILYSLVWIIFYWLFIAAYRYIVALTVSWLFSHLQFILIPLFTLLGICTAILIAGTILGLLCFMVYKLILACKNNFSEVKTRASILLILEISLFFMSAKKRNFSPILVLSISHLISVSWASLSRFGDYTLVSGDSLLDGQSIAGLVSVAVRVVVLQMKDLLSRLKEHKAKKFIEFAIGTIGAILFQNFFSITSFGEVAAFLYLAVMWLANLVLLGFCYDFGIFNFLLANVVVGCTVGQFGLHSATWLALGAALLLFALRLKLESVAMAYEEAQRIELFMFW